MPPPINMGCTSHPSPGEHLALVRLHGQVGIFVRDITDINHPVNRCTLSGGLDLRFVSATKLTYLVGGSDLGSAVGMYMVDLTTATTSLVKSWPSSGALSQTYAWSPDGTKLTYISSTANNNVEWHLESAAGDKVLLGLGNIAGRDLNSDNDDAFVGFSADGKYVAIEQTLTGGKGANGSPPPIQVNRVSDGSIAYSRSDGTMAAWAGAGARLYFRTGAGVQAWDPAAGVLTVSAGTSWIHPHPSPDGSRMAFSVLNAQGNHVANVLDLTSSTGAVQQLSPQPRAGAAFIDASLVWYAGENICTTASPCGLGGPPLSGTTYIYDLGSGVESGSLDTNLYDAWPHVAGQS